MSQINNIMSIVSIVITLTYLISIKITYFLPLCFVNSINIENVMALMYTGIYKHDVICGYAFILH